MNDNITPEELARRRKAFDRQVDDTIARVGWVVMAVGSSDTTPAFAYTVGLSQANLPELVIVGNLAPGTLGNIINPIAQKMFIDKEAIKVGPATSGFVLKTNEELRLEVRVVIDRKRALQNYVIQAADLYGPGVDVMQVIWGDDKNVLPTEPGYNLEMVQPLL